MIIIDEEMLSEETLKSVYNDLYNESIIDLIKYKLREESKKHQIISYLNELNVNEAEELMHLSCDAYNYKGEKERERIIKGE